MIKRVMVFGYQKERVSKMKVVYGHTDSIFVQINDVEKAQEICDKIDKHMKTVFPNVMGLEEHPVKLEFEKFYSTLGVGASKNRNAGFITWKDGEWLEEEQFIVTGFSMKRISESPMSKKFQSDLLKKWASGDTEHDIVSFCREQYNNVKKGRISLDEVIKRGRLHNDLNNYKSIAGGIAGVCYYNQHINPENPITDSFVYFKCANIDGPQYIILPSGRERRAVFVAFREKKEITAKYHPHWGAYAEDIIKKATPIFLAMEWEIKNVMLDESQKTLGEWF